MRILSMTATFGKLEHETLTLKPGLNIVEAPNEWGKSTWCAFLVAMLYGIETREKTTKTALAVKEHYLPWSGSPMAGRMDIQWNGRDITIERKTKGRVPLGDFRAYETESGLAVPELTAANCGLALLGVEKSVFLRSAFIRQNEMGVSQDDALRRRLNALVTTGDESGDGDKLAKGLKELKNKVRYNRSGLLPQAEDQRAQLENTLRELDALESQNETHAARLQQLQTWHSQLENHQTALRYAAAQADAQKVSAARNSSQEAAARLKEAEEACRSLPERTRAEQRLLQLRKLEETRSGLQVEEAMLPLPPEAPEVPLPFRDMNPADAVEKARQDADTYTALSQKKNPLPVLGGILILAAIALAFFRLIPGLILGATGIVLLAVGLAGNRRRKQAMEALSSHYGSHNCAGWLQDAEAFARTQAAYAAAQAQWQTQRRDLDQRAAQLEETIQSATGGLGLTVCREKCQAVLALWDRCAAAHRDAQHAQHYYTTLSSMVKTAEPPAMADTLSYSEPETARLLSDCGAQQQMLTRLVSQNQGRMEALGKKEDLTARLSQVNARIRRLEDTFAALTIAQETLATATAELQRRFAPRISARARELLSRLTQGRYDRLFLAEDLTLRSGALQEDTIREAVWRSDGTIDQLYLALRLAVAEELAMDAPLILDDALVRFDDTRAKAALEILREEGDRKQVILFTCQSREAKLL